jgi:uncharacterized protein YbcI
MTTPHDPQTDLPPLASADELTAAANEVADESMGAVRAKLANAMVGLKKEFYGRGPEAAKAWILDEYVLVVLEGGLTKNEETLLRAGREDVVRDYRLTFQETVGQTTKSSVEQILGRQVLTYHSQIVFGPTRSFEIFVLDKAPATD